MARKARPWDDVALDFPVLRGGSASLGCCWGDDLFFWWGGEGREWDGERSRGEGMGRWMRGEGEGRGRGGVRMVF